MEINKEAYYELYKEIYETCSNEGELFPLLLSEIYVPDKYQFSLNELVNLKESISDSNHLKQEKKSMERRVLEKEIISKYSKWNDEEMIRCNNEFEELNIKELNDFLRKYPKFNKIIIGEDSI